MTTTPKKPDDVTGLAINFRMQLENIVGMLGGEMGPDASLEDLADTARELAMQQAEDLIEQINDLESDAALKVSASAPDRAPVSLLRGAACNREQI